MLQSMELEDLFSTENGELKQVVTVHSEMFVYAHQNPALLNVMDRTVNTIDGRVVLALCSLLYPGCSLKKMSGSDFIYNLAEHAMSHKERVFLLGAEAASNREAQLALKTRHSGLIVDGYSPPFSSNIKDAEWNAAIFRKIAEFRPSHLAVCFGPLKQEIWISENAGRLFELGVRCAYGLGGTLDFVSGRKKRAPKWIQKAGVEWLFRVLCEPQRVGRTAQMFKMPYFALKFHHREVRITSVHGGLDAGPAPQREGE
jgi:N-acetylglucosaminyldiphosphoundecaprenol N-acetyl-beta-D-mannosaminyltransferase